MEHQGAAPATGVQAHIASGDTSFTILSGTGYPTGSVGPFILCIDPGTASEEKILCASRSGTTVTVAGSGRGYDGTSASAHSVGTTNVQHVLGAIEVDDDNDHVYTTTRDDHTQYARTDGTRAITGTQHFSSQIVVASGSTITTGGETISAGGLTVTAGGISVSAGTTAVQALTATTVTGTGEVKGTDMNATGLTGATAGTRFVGATSAGGPPASGTFITGDMIVDQKYGITWVCTTGGTPGTWANVGGGNVYCQGYRNSAWTTSSTGANIAFDTALNDPNSMLNTGTGVITIPVAGLYLVVTQFQYTSTATTQNSRTYIQKNGSQVVTGPIAQDATVAAEGVQGTNISGYVLCAVNDTITIGNVTSTNALTGSTGAPNTFVHVRLT